MYLPGFDSPEFWGFGVGTSGSDRDAKIDRAVAPRPERGGTCRVRVEFGKARCRFHGGLSTGPKTEAGRARIAEAQRRRWRLYRERRQLNVVS
jgi:hypothetical protein